MTEHISAEAGPQSGAGYPASSRQVNWYETYAFASNLAAQQGLSLDHRVLPIAGTPQWCGMADDDARKLLALVLGGVREALTNDTGQEAMTEASREISAAADWSAIARDAQRRNDVYIRRAS